MKKFLTLTYLFIAIIGYGQEVIHIKFDWQDIKTEETIKNLKVNYLSFEGASMNYKYGSLPIFSHELDSPDEVYSYEIDIINAVFDTLSIEKSQMISDLDLATNDIEYWIQENSNTTNINVLPIKRDANSLQLILLKEFSIVLCLIPVEEIKGTSVSEPAYSNNSVLSEGQWFKLGIVNTGVHKIDWNYVSSMGLNPSEINVNEIGIFGNYLGMLPEDNGKPRLDDLQENSVEYVGMEDGSFDEEDFILFFAQSQETWRFNPFTVRFDHSKNIYADTIFYFFTPNQGTHKVIEPEESLSVVPTEVVTSFIDYLAHENDFVNLMFTGKEWFGERLSMEEPEITFTHIIPNLIIEKSVYLQFDIVARAYENSSFEVFVNDILVVDSTRISKVDPSSEGIYARRSTRTETFMNHDEDILQIKPVYQTALSSASAWINYYVLNFERELIFDGGQMNFRQPTVTALGNNTRFEVSNNSQNVDVWDITDSHNPLKVIFEENDELVEFTLATDSLREFVIFDNTNIFKPASFRSVENQNLHGITAVDFVIISPDEFRDQAERLAYLHYDYDGMNTIVVSPEVIYNEFCSGTQDVSAIRDFMRMLYKKEVFKNGPGYLLAFGDGSFDYKKRIHENTNLVPTYESQESLRATLSYVTDDFFGLLDNDEGAYCAGVLDIGIGRFPVKNIEEATVAVDKIENYLKKDKNTVNNWAKSICFIADDGDNNLHFRQADLQLATIADTLHSGIEVKKIYSDSYSIVEVPGGHRYPDVNIKINEQVENGALILNYTGHGGLIGWSEELILDVPMIHSFDNKNNMPLFITATCEFSRFDNPEFTSAGEYVFLNENGGGIALLTTTRLAYAHANIIVNMRIYNNLLEREDGSRPRLGDMIRMAKNPSSTNFLNFTLLGDPALRLAFPEKEIETLLVNNKNVSADPDTVSALMEVNIEGVIKNDDGNDDANFNGYIYPVVYDKASKYHTLGNMGSSYPAEFELEDKVLYKGKSTVVNGHFSFSFLVPKDISYNYGYGKISYYAYDTLTYTDAWGGFDNIVIGGLNEEHENDGIGPDISLYVNNRNFVTGDNVENDLTLIADLFDENGINHTGHSLGRDIVAVIDDNSSISINLNENFTSDIDTYKKGNVIFNIGALETGWHTLSLKAWDLMNNSSTQSIEFYVGSEHESVLSEVYNYPNPAIGNTTFTFNYNGSSSLENLEIKIFDIRGQYITSLTDEGTQNSSKVEIEWNGTDNNGKKLPPGVFVYNIIVTDQQGNTSVQQQKMILLNE